MSTNNSITTILPQFYRLFNNNLESFQKIQEAILSNEKSITIDIRDLEGNITNVTIPGWGYILNSISRIDNTINTLTNLDTEGGALRQPDGTLREILLNKIPSEARDIESLNNISNFQTESNWFFDELINPLIKVNFNLTGKVPSNTESIIVRKYILDDENLQSKINFFKNNYEGKNEINYNSFIRDLVNNNYSYVLDEKVINISPKEKRYFGKFNIIKITDTQITENINGVDVTKNTKLYKLNKLSYSDKRAGYKDTVSLKKGDFLEVNSNPVTTRYEITSVDSSTNSITLRLIEGYENIKIGTDILKISSSLNDTVNLKVPVGLNERCVIFLKPIDPYSRIPSTNWSPGSGFYTNNLVTTDTNGNEIFLSQYYQNSVLDFGKFLLSYSQDKLITSREGLIPNKVTLNESDFKVKLVNSQIMNSSSIVELEDLNTQKKETEAKINELDSSIKKIKTKIQTTNYSSEVERDSDKQELRTFINERENNVKLYSSLVNEIQSKSKDNSIISAIPKYKARGFWAIPKERYSDETGLQKIIKFKIRYRYLSREGSSNPNEEFVYTNIDDEKLKGSFSNYIITESLTRKRVKNTTTGLFQWEDVDTLDSEEVNINQLDIPIKKGEGVEVQVKSISEAGWPSNPLESDWSNPIIINFPDDLSSDNPVERIINQNKQDLAKVNIENDLIARGIDEHLADSFDSNENYFSHTASSIASGFLSENQTPINLFTKLTQLQNRIDLLSEILRNAQGKLSVYLNTQTSRKLLSKDKNNKIFSGYYLDEIKNLDNPKGAIISKTFFISLTNSEQTGLQLISRIRGNRKRMVRQSEPNGSSIISSRYEWLDNNDTYETSDVDYNTIRKYDLCPIILTNPTVDANNEFGQTVSLPPYQSTQNKNQFLYVRYKDVSDDESLFNYKNPIGNVITNLDQAEDFYSRTVPTSSVNPNDFIWGGDFDNNGDPTTSSTFNQNNDDGIEIHIDHPYIKSRSAFEQAYNDITGYVFNLNDLSYIEAARIMFRHSKFIHLNSSNDNFKKQCIYLNEDVQQTNNPSTSLDYFRSNNIDYSRNVKYSFESYDQYLLGKKSCGAYLFISPDSHESIQVDGDSVQSGIVLQFGEENSINIPVTFQYRMTDYFSLGQGGSGNIAGDLNGSIINLTYSKKIGIDIYPNSQNVQQYDLEFYASYKNDNLNKDSIPSRDASMNIRDLSKVLDKINPNINEVRVNNEVSDGFYNINKNDFP